MIALLNGRVAAATLSYAVISAGGVGLQVYATPDTLATLRVGEEGELHTHLVVREDSLTLYGFATADARDVFATLQTVSGVGPRLALATLAVLDPDALRRAVAEKDDVALARVPGIGKKTAQRLLLDLAGKLGAPTGETPVATVVAPVVGTASEEVVAALTSLGWPAKVADETVGALVKELGDVDQATLLRASLRSLGGGGRA